jgi:membrane-associated phospholipid phosphatase
LFIFELEIFLSILYSYLYFTRMKISKKLRKELLPTLSRISPVLILLFALLNCILNPTYNSFYLLIILIIVFPVNWVIKHLFFQQLYKLLKTNSLPLLGIGARPYGAKNCDFIPDDNKFKSYGMPSGHSQIIWTFGTYIISKLIYNCYYTVNNPITTTQIQIIRYILVILSTLFILSIMIYVSYSRVYIEGCHTIQQVIVGGFLGVLLGFLVYYYESDAINLLSKIF